MIRTVLFDLDGTLLDTAPDLAYALNIVRNEQNLKPIPYEQIRPAVSHGGLAMIRLGFTHTHHSNRFEELRQRLLQIYQENIAENTALFPGMEKVLHHIESSDMKWGVVTNKPSWLTDPLMKKMHLFERSSCVISGDTTDNRKPHPEPMILACRQCNSTVEECLYIGDAERDIQAGRRAGMSSLVAQYGYINDDDDINQWGADDIISAPEDIIIWLNNHNGQTPSPGNPPDCH